MSKPIRTSNRGKKLTAARPVSLLKQGSVPKEFHESLYIREIHYRAQTITPLLETILNYRPNPTWNH